MTAPFDSKRAAELVAELRSLPGGLNRRVADQLEAASAEVERLRVENMQQASRLLDPDATCCADATRRTREMRLAHEAERDSLRAEIEEMTRAKAILAGTMDEAVRRYVADEAENIKLRAEVDRLRFYETTSAAEVIRELQRIRPVFEAAKAWRGEPFMPPPGLDVEWTHLDRALSDAVDAALAAQGGAK